MNEEYKLLCSFISAKENIKKEEYEIYYLNTLGLE
jgi:hypothetical protein